MFGLQYALHSQEMIQARVQLLNEIGDIQLGRVLGRPPISIRSLFMDIDKSTLDLRDEKGFAEIQKILDIWKSGNAQESYIQAARYLEKYPSSIFSEWLHFFKADALFRVQEGKDKPQYSLSLEDYELAIRRYPLSAHVERALYQMALSEVRSGLFQESQVTIRKALKEFPNGLWYADFLLLSGEAYLLSKNLDAALSEFSQLIRRFPKSSAAVDAAFRRAYLYFERNKFNDALKTYEDLDRYHSQVLQYLQMQTEASAENKFADRVLYAETLYLNGRHSEAAKIFQALGNLFPKDPRAPLLWIRFGDSFLLRNMMNPARAMYEFVAKEFKSSPAAQAWANIKTADLNFLSGSVRAQQENWELLEKAFQLTLTVQPEVASLALAKLVQFGIFSKSYARAQVILEQYRSLFPKGAEIAWVNRKSSELLEKEILDHYKAGDYLAALTRFITHENDETVFKNAEVLFRLSDAARELDLIEKSSEILNRIIYLEESSSFRQIALLRLAENLISQGEHKKASERLRRFNFAYPKTAYQYLYDKLWGDLYRALKNAPRALEHYERAIRGIGAQENRKIELRQVLLYLAELYESEGLSLKAIEAYEAYLRIYEKPEQVILRGIPLTDRDKHQIKVAQYRIADTYFEMRDYVRALTSYQRVSERIKDEPFLSHARYRIGECFLALGDRQAAIKAFKDLKSDDPQNIWVRAAKAYVDGVQMEVNYGIRIFN